MATLVAAISFITGLGGLAFTACIIQVGAFPYIHFLFTEAVLESPIPTIEVPLTPITTPAIINPPAPQPGETISEMRARRIDEIQEAFATELDNEVLTPDVITTKLAFWIALPGGQDHLHTPEMEAAKPS